MDIAAYRSIILCACCVAGLFFSCSAHESTSSPVHARRMQPDDGKLNENVELQEEKVIFAIHDWHVSKGWGAPVRIVIREKTEAGWWVSVGPSIKEKMIRINPDTLTILEWIPGR